MVTPSQVAVIHRDAELRHLRCLVCGEEWGKARTATSPDVCPQEKRHGKKPTGPRIPKRPTLSNGPPVE